MGPMRRRWLGWIAILASACGSPEAPRREAPPVIAPVPPPPPAAALTLPRAAGSVKFAVIGDSGRGHRPQYEVSAQMQRWREQFPFDFVVMAGDNVYDGGTPEDYRQKFELPYKPLLDAKVRFYATIGNHDDPGQPSYAPFNMGGQRYYTFEPPTPLLGRLTGVNARFFMVDTERLDAAQLAWLDRELQRSNADWKIPVFHRPIYSSGRYARPAQAFRLALEPLFVRHGVRVAFSGHEHFYERMHPQQGITYFISGGAGSLRPGDLRPTQRTARGFDQDYHFMIVEIARDELHFQAVSRDGRSIDSGRVRRDR
jgi:3',5'-cyclic AMP phosphodiesterase CpdA